MPRPRNDSMEPSAKERMREAFWEALKSEPYSALTVKGICGRAGIQRNTFYYHYDGIYALAQDAIDALPVEDFARKLIPIAFSDEGNPYDFAFSEENASQVECMMIIMGPNSSPVLLEAVKERIWRAWGTIFPLPAERPILAEFALGGMASVFGKIAAVDPEGRRAIVADAPIKQLIRWLLPQLMGFDISNESAFMVDEKPEISV